MPTHPTKRCGKCFHPLPYGRRTWSPFWSWYEEAGGPRLTYAADGPPLGYVMPFTDPYGTHFYRAYALVSRPERGKAWPNMGDVTVEKGTLGCRTRRNAIRIVEAVVRERGLWLRNGKP